MTKARILVTCPPMLGLFDDFESDFESAGLQAVAATTTQVLSEQALIDILPDYDGWIFGDDPATRRVVEAGQAGKLRAAVKWGVGTDNVDFTAFEALGIPVENTPGVFGNEVADVALCYTLGLARETFWIDRQVRLHNSWPKPTGISMVGRTVALVGFGDIGQQIAKRIIACGSKVVVYDPHVSTSSVLDVQLAKWPDRLEDADFIIFACPLTPETQGMFNEEILDKLKYGTRVINVARGPVIVEDALVKALEAGIVKAAALDVFEVEPLPADSPLRGFEKCIFGTHNSSNSQDAVRRVSRLAIEKLARLLCD